jgi:hypothetical protein
VSHLDVQGCNLASNKGLIRMARTYGGSRADGYGPLGFFSFMFKRVGRE